MTKSLNFFQLEQSAAEGGKSSSSSSSASTRVAEFRSKFEKFGSLKSKKADDQFRSLDIVDASRDLERQIAEIETAHAEERRQFLERIETQRTELEKENKELSERNAAVIEIDKFVLLSNLQFLSVFCTFGADN